jgi:hypothetical protein
VRRALARRMELDRHYSTANLRTRQDIDQKIAACLNQKFDDQFVVSSTDELGESTDWLNELPEYRRKKFSTDEFKRYQSNWIYLITSDGRKVPKLSVDASDSIARTCGGLTKNLDPYPNDLYGPNHEMAFPRFMDGKPTIAPGDTVIRLKVDLYHGELDFKIDKLIFQGKRDF